MMQKVPKKLKICPIKESIFEIRFSTDIPSDAIFGIVYSHVGDIFPKNSIKQLPILQIPEQLRNNDPKLKYQALHRLIKDNLSLSVGPNVLTFGNHQEYVGWTRWSEFFENIIEKLKSTNIFQKVERIGLRYINIFNENIFNNLNIELKINKNKLINETSNLRTELLDSGFIKILQIGNAVKIQNNTNAFTGSLIDIDCIYNFNNESFIKIYLEIVNKAHDKEKELFFSILKKDYLNKFEPNY